jgi:hypothetical protein
MPVPKFDAHIENGLPVIDDSRFPGYCSQWENGTKVDVIVRRKRKAVSDRQFRYLYGVVYLLIAKRTGHDVDEIDGMMKHKFLRCIDDYGLEYIPSKTEMSTVDDEEYAEKIRRWASIVFEPPLIIPLPNEVELPQHALVA